MTIRKIYIAARDTRGADADDQHTGPPGRELNLAIIGSDAHLSVVELDESGNRQPGSDVVVPSRSLLRALHAAIDDENSDEHNAPGAR